MDYESACVVIQLRTVSVSTCAPACADALTVCGAPACADVLTAQATGKTHFRLTQDLVGDVQWEGRCKQCYKEWHDKYGFPTLVS